jgi:hypothetical protein
MLNEKFDRVVTLSKAAETDMREVAVSKRVVLRFDMLPDSPCDTYDDILAASDAVFSVDIEDVATRCINAYNYSPFRQAVVVCSDNDVQLRKFDALRDKMHEQMLATNPGAYACEFTRLHSPPGEVHAHRINSKGLYKVIKAASDKKEVRVVLGPDELSKLDMDNASKDSVILVDGNWWVASGFAIIRQDSQAKTEHGFKMLNQMLEDDRSGMLLTKRQFFEGHDYRMLRHLILPAVINDIHLLYQLFERVARGPEYCMVTITGGTSIDVVRRMLDIYDPDAVRFQLERFENIPLDKVVARTPDELIALTTRTKKMHSTLTKSQPTPPSTILKDTVKYLYKHFRHTPPSSKILRNPYSVAWETQLVKAIESCKNMDRPLFGIEWLDFNRENSFLPTRTFFDSDRTIYMPTENTVFSKVRLTSSVQVVVDYYAKRGEPIPRGMHSVCSPEYKAAALAPVHLIGILHRLMRKAPDEYNLPNFVIPDALLDSPVRRIDLTKDTKTKIVLKLLSSYQLSRYETCLARFSSILRAEEVKPALYDINCSFQTRHANVVESLLPLHKWNVGYAADMPYSTSGHKDTNPTDEKPQHLQVKEDDFGLHSNVYAVHERLSHLQGLTQNHNTLNHKLSKIFYVQLIIFFILIPLSKESVKENANGQSFAPLLSLLNALPVHATIQIEENDSNDKKRMRTTY